MFGELTRPFDYALQVHMALMRMGFSPADIFLYFDDSEGDVWVVLMRPGTKTQMMTIKCGTLKQPKQQVMDDWIDLMEKFNSSTQDERNAFYKASELPNSSFALAVAHAMTQAGLSIDDLEPEDNGLD